MYRRRPGSAHIDRLVRTGVLLVVLFAAIVTSASASTPTSAASDTPASTGTGFHTAPDAKTIDTMLQALASQRRFNGAVLVGRNGHVLLERAYGKRGLPAGVHTRFRIGSITKTFTAVAVVQLAATDRLGLHTSICHYLPRCPAAWRPITPTMLLSHTAGLSAALDDESWQSLARVPLTRLVERLRHLPLRARPGTRWAYCNACYLVAGYLVERVSGESWFRFVRRHILAPARMHATVPDPGWGRDRGTGYFSDRSARLRPAPFQALGTPDPAGGLLSTAHDLYLFSRALDNGTLLSRRWLQAMFHVAPATHGTWGLGWELGTRRGHPFARHTGSIQGWSAIFNRYLDDKLTLVVLSNLSDGNVDFINHQIPAILFRWPYDFPTPPHAVKLPAAALERLVGTYAATQGSLRLQVNRTARGLVLYPGPSGGGDLLVPLSATEFADQHDPRWHATFTLEDGVAIQLRMRNIPQGYSFRARRTDAPSRHVAGHDSRVIVPRPTGTLPVGTATLTLVDRARPDPFASDRERRRILAQVYYPSVDGDGARARYMPPGVARVLASKAVPARALSSITTNARPEARARHGRYPVLIFSPGYSVPHALYTGLLEDLASRGYVVIAVDHTRETEAVQFPNGAIVRRTLPVDPKNLILKAIKARTDDVTFVIKSLTGLRRRAALAGADTSKIGLLGHSLGGLTAANVASRQPAVVCAADIAGSVYGDARQRSFRRPFLILDGNQRESTLPRWWANLKGVRYWVTLTTAKHLNFTDWTWLVPALKARGLTPHVENLGAIDGKRALDLERQYVGAFFDECLKHRPGRLLNDPRPQADVRVKH